MKRLAAIVLSVLCGAVGLRGQGTVNFQNISGTGLPAGVAGITNTVTSQRVPAGTTFLAQLYYGPVGASQESLVAVNSAPVGFSSPGLFVGGTRVLDASVIGDCSAGPQRATLQVRVWESWAGSTWEQAFIVAITHPDPVRGPVLGLSGLFTVTTGNPCAVPPGTPANLLGFRGFVISCPLSVRCPEPGSLALGLVGGIALFAFRRGRSRSGSRR